MGMFFWGLRLTVAFVEEKWLQLDVIRSAGLCHQKLEINFKRKF